MTGLFDPLQIRGVTLRNRIGVSPMCQYSSTDGYPNEWHLVHLGSRAAGGAALVIAEATAVTAEGRISANDLGIWKDAHIEEHGRIARFIEGQGAVPGIQIAHAGRKASTLPPWELTGRSLEDRHPTLAEGRWEPIAPSAIPFDERSLTPREMSREDIAGVVKAFAAAALRAAAAGYGWIEIHAAHGYLLHSFLSPLSNQRSDEYGGSLENRTRLAREVVRAVRDAWPDRKPLAVRVSHTDWVPGGWTTEETVVLAQELKSDGADLIDVSSGGSSPNAQIPVGPGFQVPGARAVRQGADVAVAAVGFITTPTQAQRILQAGHADIVLLARELLRDPYWPIHAAIELKETARMRIPVQYQRAYADLGAFSVEPLGVRRVAALRARAP